MKHVQTFQGFLNEAKMTPKKLADALMNADETAKENLRINSAEPVYQDPIIRKAWIEKIKEEIQKIGIADIKASWKKIYSELEDNNYHQLNLFLGLALKVDPKYVAMYTRRSEETKGPYAIDANAYKDFLSINL